MTLKEKNKDFDTRNFLNGVDKRRLQLDHLWWLRSDKQDKFKSMTKTFECICRIADISQTNILFSGHLAVDLKIFKIPIQKHIQDKIFISDLSQFVKTINDTDNEMSVIEYQSQKYLFQFDKRYWLLDQKNNISEHSKYECRTIINKKIFLNYTLHALITYPLANLKLLLDSGFRISFKRNLVSRVNAKLRKILYYLFTKLGCTQTAYKLRYFYMSKKEFLNLSILPNSPLDLLVREQSIQLISADWKIEKFCDLIDFYGIIENRDLILKKTYLKKNTFDTNYSTHYDLQFWDCSNAHYILPLLFGFRKNIASYDTTRGNKTLKQLTSRYFKSQEKMNREDIQNLFEFSPPIICGDEIVSGRHRMIALAGHLMENKIFIAPKVAYF